MRWVALKGFEISPSAHLIDSLFLLAEMGAPSSFDLRECAKKRGALSYVRICYHKRLLRLTMPTAAAPTTITRTVMYVRYILFDEKTCD